MILRDAGNYAAGSCAEARAGEPQTRAALSDDGEGHLCAATVQSMSETLVPVLAAALSSLVAYVEARPGTTEDDDVRALEDVAHRLATLSDEEQKRLRQHMSASVAEGLGLAG